MIFLRPIKAGIVFARRSNHQYARPGDPIGFQVLECAVGVRERVDGRMRSDGDFRGFGEQFATVLAGVAGDGMDVPFVKQCRCSPSRGSATCEFLPGPACPLFEPLQRRRDQFAGGSEDDRTVDLDRHLVGPLADPDRPHLSCQLAMFFPSRDHIHFATAGLGNLNDHMGRGTETIQGQLSPGRQLCPFQGAIADDSSAQQRRGFNIGERLGNRIGKVFLDNGVFGVAPVGMIAGEPRPLAQVLPSGPAVPANSTRVAEPCNADPRRPAWKRFDPAPRESTSPTI